MKEKVNRDQVGGKIDKINEIKSGDLLIKLHKSSNAKDIKDAVSAAIGSLK